jgi:hypothetical protein
VIGTWIVKALAEARIKFGPVTPENRQEQCDWVKKRVQELRAAKHQVAPYQPKGMR